MDEALWKGHLSSAAVVRFQEPLARRTTLRVGGPADVWVEPADGTDLSAVLRLCAEHGWPWLVLGRGSNLLVRDGGVRGVVISLGQPGFAQWRVEAPELHCGAGVRLKTVAVEARRNGVAGLEFLEGIPGSVGGALRMNAGAMGAWMFQVVRQIRYMDPAGDIHEQPAAEIATSYRQCPLLRSHIALGAVLSGQLENPEAVAERMLNYSRKRWESQPPQPSAGCIFKNPSAIPAGRLIQELGLKGAAIGAAMVSGVHGNFIVNTGQASASEVLELIALVKARALSERGIQLETEVEIIGEGASCV